MADPVIKLTYDSKLTFGADATLTASSDSTNVVTIGTNNRIIRFALVTDILSHKISATDETLSIVLNLSKASDMSNPVVAETVVIENETSAVGRRYIETSNRVAGEDYKYAELSYVITGTSPTTSIECYISPIPKS